MKPIFTFILAAGIAWATPAFSQELLDSIRRIVSIEKSEIPYKPAEYLAETDNVIRAWNKASTDERTQFAIKMFLMHFRRAEILAASGNFKDASEELTAEAVMQKEFGGRIEFATKSPDTFFRDLIELQALVTAETGSDPLVDKVGYSFQKEGDGFTAARLELSDDVAGITVPDIESDEALALVHRISRQSGQFVVSAPKWLVVPKGKLPDVLKQAKREVEFDSTGIMTVTNLQAGGSQESTVTNLDNATASSQLPSIVRPPIPKNASDSESVIPTLSNEPPSSTSWSIIAVLMVAAISIVWLVLKKRK
jgi:hypothetical protein